MSTETIQRRAKEAASFYQTVLMCGRNADLESVFVHYLTAQQAADTQAHAAEVEKLRVKAERI